MALHLVQYTNNPLTYPIFERCWESPPSVWPLPASIGSTINNPFLVTCPKQCSRSLRTVSAFFYVGPPDDMYVLWGLNYEVRWPGWSIMKWYFDASTGILKEASDMGGYIFVTTAEIGEFNHVYATFGSTTDCWQINYKTAANESSSWCIHPYGWNPKRIFSNLVVNRQNDRIIGVQYPYLEIWDNVTSITPTRTFQMRLPYSIRDMAYESNQYVWAISTNGQIYKIDWKDNKRIEMLSSIQITPSDKDYFAAYDTYRKRLCIFRWMEDATDGSAQNRIEFYEAVPKPACLIAPVPITRHRSGDFTKFVAKIVGDMGEGFGGATGTASLVSPNNHGKILSPTVLSGITGDFNISYQTPNTEISVIDTIKLEVELPEDIGEIEV
jgi:hypothetical protein